MFYLLLLSLSEHLKFGVAYVLSSGACVALTSHYLGAVLGGRVAAIGFGAGLTGLYALLYGLLGAEDYALLMGSILIFALLGLFMALTRKVDWFASVNTGSQMP
jgi:inner membrane protein